MRFLYFYLMSGARRRPSRCTGVRRLLAGAFPRLHEGGPFADREGGLILLETDSLDEAERLAADDPIRRLDLIDQYWLKECMVA